MSRDFSTLSDGSQITTSGRLAYLDSIRGIAAFTVLLYHCWASAYDPLAGGLNVAFTSAPNLTHYLLEKALAGRAAVMVFFVLSGFVLAESLQRQPLSFGRFAVKRFFRIYPSFLCVVLASYALHSLIGVRRLPETQLVLEEIVNANLSIIALLKCLLFWGTEDVMKLDVVTWSLVHEMRISLLFPFIFRFVLRHHWRAVGFFGVASALCTFLSFFLTGKMSNGIEETTIIASLLASGFFVVFFAAGALLSIEKQAVAASIAALSSPQKTILFLAVGLCLTKAGKAVPADYITGLGAVGLIAAALGTARVQRYLTFGILTWSGRISYSLYLVHIPVIYVVLQYIGGQGLTLAPIIIGLTIVFAMAVNRLVEVPSNEFGKWLVTRTTRGLAGRVGPHNHERLGKFGACRSDPQSDLD